MIVVGILLLVLSRDLSIQPRSGESPLAEHGPIRNLQDRARIFYTESTKKPQFNHPALARVDFSKCTERIIELQKIARLLRSIHECLIERCFGRTSATFRTLVNSGHVDENSPHQLRGDREEMSSILPINIRPANQPDVCLINQCCRLQRMIRPLAGQVPPREPLKLSLHARHESFQCLFIALPPRAQELRYFMVC